MLFRRKKRTADRFKIERLSSGNLSVTFFTDDPPWGYIPSVGDYVLIGDERWYVNLRIFDIRTTALRLDKRL